MTASGTTGYSRTIGASRCPCLTPWWANPGPAETVSGIEAARVATAPRFVGAVSNGRISASPKSHHVGYRCIKCGSFHIPHPFSASPAGPVCVTHRRDFGGTGTTAKPAREQVNPLSEKARTHAQPEACQRFLRQYRSGLVAIRDLTSWESNRYFLRLCSAQHVRSTDKPPPAPAEARKAARHNPAQVPFVRSCTCPFAGKESGGRLHSGEISRFPWRVNMPNAPSRSLAGFAWQVGRSPLAGVAGRASRSSFPRGFCGSWCRRVPARRT